MKLPGSDGGRVYLPIDSKFPGDTYMHLQEAAASGNPQAVAEARKALETVLKKSAKDIRDKYVEPPYTTTFGILFLPFEGLYAEVVNMGMIEVLQKEYSINVAGPSTMAALLNSLQMGFRTLAIQKRSSEVWQVLGAVKTEFTKFEDVMQKMQGHLQQTSKDLDTLMAPGPGPSTGSSGMFSSWRSRRHRSCWKQPVSKNKNRWLLQKATAPYYIYCILICAAEETGAYRSQGTAAHPAGPSQR